MANNKIKAINLEGYFIYHDEKGRTFYSLPFSKTGYVIGNADAEAYYLYQLRPLACILVALVMYFVLRIPVIYSCLTGIGIYAISTVIFFTKFLKKLPKKENFIKPDKHSFVEEQAKNSSVFKLVIIPLFAVLLIIGISLAIKAKSYKSLYSLLLGLLAIGGYSVYAILELAALIVKLTGPKKNK